MLTESWKLQLKCRDKKHLTLMNYLWAEFLFHVESVVWIVGNDRMNIVHTRVFDGSNLGNCFFNEMASCRACFLSEEMMHL